MQQEMTLVTHKLSASSSSQITTTNIPIFYRRPSCHPTNSVKELKVKNSSGNKAVHLVSCLPHKRFIIHNTVKNNFKNYRILN